MPSFGTKLKTKYLGFFKVLARFFSKRLKLNPQHILLLGFASSILAAFLILRGYFYLFYISLFFSLLFAALDKTMIRHYDPESRVHKVSKIILDRLSAGAIYYALWQVGYINTELAVIAYGLILFVTFLSLFSKRDFGGKLLPLFLAPFMGFYLSFFLIFGFQLTSILVSVTKLSREFKARQSRNPR